MSNDKKAPAPAQTTPGKCKFIDGRCINCGKNMTSATAGICEAASVPAPAPSTEPLLYELTQALILKKWPLRPDPEDIAQMMEGLLLEPYGGAHCVLCGGRINCADCRPSVPSGHEDGCRMPEFLKFYWPERNAALAPAPSTEQKVPERTRGDQILNAIGGVLSKLESQVMRNPDLPRVYKMILAEGYAARDRVQWLLSNLCPRHQEIQSMSCGKCAMCEKAALAPAPSEAPQNRFANFTKDELHTLLGAIRREQGWTSNDGQAERLNLMERQIIAARKLGAPSEAKPTTELKSEQAEEEFYKWWQPKTLIGGRFHGYSENWGAKDAWVAARLEPPAEASLEGKPGIKNAV